MTSPLPNLRQHFLLSRIIGETGIFLAEVAAWFGADVVLITSYLYVIRKVEASMRNNNCTAE